MPKIRFMGTEEVKLLPTGYTTAPIITEAQDTFTKVLNGNSQAKYRLETKIVNNRKKA